MIARPRWGVLYAVVFLTLTALTVENLVTPDGARTTLDGAIAVAALVAITLWLRGNRVALDQQDWCECAADTLTVRVIPSCRLERQGAPAPRPTIPRVLEPIPREENDEVFAVSSKA